MVPAVLFSGYAMPSKANPSKLNPLQLRTLTLLQAIAQIPDAAKATSAVMPKGRNFH